MVLLTATFAPACAAEAGSDGGEGIAITLVDGICSAVEPMAVESLGQDPQRDDFALENGLDGEVDTETDSSHAIEGRARDLQALDELFQKLATGHEAATHRLPAASSTETTETWGQTPARPDGPPKQQTLEWMNVRT